MKAKTKTVIIRCLLILLLTAIIGFLYLLCPIFIGKIIRNKLQEDYNVMLEVRNLSFGSVDFANISRNDFSADSVRCDYSLNFLGKKPFILVEKLEISGVSLRVINNNGKWEITGFDDLLLESSNEKLKIVNIPSATQSSQKLVLPFGLNRLNIKNSEIIICHAEETLKIPFSVTIAETADDNQHFKMLTYFELFGKSQKGEVELNLADNKVLFHLKGKYHDFLANFVGNIGLEKEKITFQADLFVISPSKKFENKLNCDGFFDTKTQRSEIKIAGNGKVDKVFCIFSALINYGEQKASFSASVEPQIADLLIKPVEITGRFTVAEKLTYQIILPEIIAPKLPFARANAKIVGNLSEFSGECFLPEIDNLPIKLVGKIAKDSCEITTKIENFELINPLKYDNFSALGKIYLQSKISLQNGEIKSSLNLRFRQFNIENKILKVAFNNLNFSLKLEDLVNIRSLPGQKITIEKIVFDDKKFENIEAFFQVQSPGNITIEKAEIQWGEGLMHIPSINIKAGQKEIRSIIYCENLELQETLVACGLSELKTSGKLYGKIPFYIGENGIVFKKGELHTIAGTKNYFKLGNQAQLEQMTQNIPNMALAMESLKNFVYDVAKVNISNQDDNLNVNLILEGAPAEELPFVFDEKSGTFTKVTGNARVKLQGLKLDLNLILPLNRLLKINEKFQKIGEKK